MNVAAVLIFIFVIAHSANAAPDIVGYERDGILLFQGSSGDSSFSLEFAPQAEGPWTNWGSLSSQPITGLVMSAPSPMFYRIREQPSAAKEPVVASCNILLFQLFSNIDFFSGWRTNWVSLESLEGIPVYVPSNTTRLVTRVFYYAWSQDQVAATNALLRIAVGEQESSIYGITNALSPTNAYNLDGVPYPYGGTIASGDISIVPTNFGWQRVRLDCRVPTTNEIWHIQTGNFYFFQSP